MMFGMKVERQERGNRGADRYAERALAALVSTGALLFGFACSHERPAEVPGKEEPGPTSEQLGAPRDTRYKADVEATRGRVRVIVREESLCDVIPVQSVIQNGKKKYIAGDPISSQPCNQRVARNVMLSLEVGGNTFRLGEPNPQGEVESNLSDRMLRDNQGKALEIGTVELSQLAASDRRLEQLLTEFRKVLDRPQAQLTGAELAHAYELYESLARFDSTDPRIGGLQALFMERLYARKAQEANEQFRNNLDALNSAKDILKANHTTIVLPSYVSSALDGGTMDDRSVDWARGQVAIAIRRYPTLCGPNPESGFTWSRLQLSPPPAESRLAFEVLRFAYDNPYEKEIAQLCRRVLG